MVININVSAKTATTIGDPVIVCGNSGYQIKFSLDEEWADVTKRIARFSYVRNGQKIYEDSDPFAGDTVEVPVLYDITEVEVGVYGGALRTSTAARILCRRSALCGNRHPKDPTPEVYERMQREVEALKNAEVVDSKLTITYPDGTVYQSESLQGPQGEQGPQGPQGEAAVTSDTYDPESSDAMSGKAVAQALQNVSTTAIPYTPVDTLPALTDSAKNVVYKYGEKYYVARVPKEVSTIYSDNIYGIGITTPKTASEIKVAVGEAGSVYNTQNLACIRDVGHSENYYLSIYYREETWENGNGGYDYDDVGYLCIKYGEYAGGYDDPYATGIGTVDDLLAGTLKIETGSEQIQLWDMTELGKAVFGDPLTWANFLTGEDNNPASYVTDKEVVKLVKQYTDEAILGGAW